MSGIKSARNYAKGDGQQLSPADLLENPVVEDLNDWLAWFVIYSSSNSGEEFGRAEWAVHAKRDSGMCLSRVLDNMT